MITPAPQPRARRRSVHQHGRTGPASLASPATPVALALLLGATLAALGACAGSWLGWRGVAPLPPLDETAVLAQALTPGSSVAHTDAVYATFAYEEQGDGVASSLLPLLGGDDYEAGYVDVVLDTSGVDGDPVTAVAGRLSRDEWNVRRDEQGGVLATGDGLRLAVYLSDTYGERLSSDVGLDRVAFSVRHEEPRRVLPLALAGFLIGAAAGYGWLRALPASRRRREAAVAAGWAAVLLLLPATTLTLLGLAGALAPGTTGPPTALYGSLMLWGVRPFALAGAVALGIGVAASLPLARLADRLQELRAR